MKAQELKDLMDTEPLNAGRLPTEVLAWLKELQDVFSNISWGLYAIWIDKRGAKATLDAALGDTPSKKKAAEYMLKVYDLGKDLEYSHADVRAIFNRIGFPAPVKADLVAYSKTQQERWSVEGFKGMGDTSWLYWIDKARAL